MPIIHIIASLSSIYEIKKKKNIFNKGIQWAFIQ